MLTGSGKDNAFEGVQDTTVVDVNIENLDFDKETKKNVLKTFIIQVRHNSNTLFKCVEKLENEDFVDIYNEVCNQSLSVYSELDISIILSCIKHLLIKYDRYFQTGKKELNVVDDILSNIKIYLQENVNYILSVKDQTIKECRDSDPDRTVVEVCCPCRKLKTVFYQQIPDNEDILNFKTSHMKDHSRTAQFMSSRDVINWPNVGISIVFPNFQITHRNIQRSEYTLIRFDSNYRPGALPGCTKLKYKTLPGNTETIEASLLCEYINQVKQFIRTTTNVRIGKKVDMLSVLSEFKTDVELCNSAITTNTEFYAPACKYPYVRYLGQPLTSDFEEPIMEYSNQIQIDEGKTNVRLLETARPTIMFNLAVFSAPLVKGEKNKYQFDMEEANLPTIRNNWLMYECLVCNKKYIGASATEEIGRHLVYEHGAEPDWICSKCNVTFSTRKLSCDRWHHDCNNVSKKLKKKKK